MSMQRASRTTETQKQAVKLSDQARKEAGRRGGADDNLAAHTRGRRD